MGEAAVRWDETKAGLVPTLVRGKLEETAAWAPQPGSQVAWLACPVTEALYEGNRGPGKTDAILIDYLQHVNQGFKEEWRGILFRRTYKELEDLIGKALKWFPRVFPQAQYNSSSHTWKFPEGESLKFRHFERDVDYNHYHGHAYPWIGWEELTNWPSDKPYRSMFSCSRSPVPGIPIKVRSTANPYGVGHNWVKARWKLPIGGNHVIGNIIHGATNPDGSKQPDRVAVHGRLAENRILLHADPQYIARIREAARNPQELKAWLHGDWNIVAGGMFDDVWDDNVHIIPNIPFDNIPTGWYMDRSYDHGQSAPFSVGWWVESNGEPLLHGGKEYGTKRGDVFRIAEWYGVRFDSKGEVLPNEGLNLLATEIAQGIVDREERWGIRGRVQPGPADTQIYNTDSSGGKSVADDMAKHGVVWTRADKGPGSRIQGWQQVRKYLKHGKNPMREEPGIFFFERCDQTVRTVPVLPRDDKILDDVNSAAEDHIGDEMRYRLRKKRRTVEIGAPRLVAVG